MNINILQMCQMSRDSSTSAQTGFPDSSSQETEKEQKDREGMNMKIRAAKRGQIGRTRFGRQRKGEREGRAGRTTYFVVS
jgi:hypothetical protein